MRTLLISLLGLALVGTVMLPAFAARNGQGRGQGERGARRGNCAAAMEAVTVHGTVKAIVMPEAGKRQGPVQFTVVDGKEETVILLGPAFYLEEIGLTMKDGDRVTVKAFNVTWEDKDPYTVASEVAVNGKTYLLRDEDGKPAWTSKGRRGGQGRGARDGARRGNAR